MGRSGYRLAVGVLAASVMGLMLAVVLPHDGHAAAVPGSDDDNLLCQRLDDGWPALLPAIVTVEVPDGPAFYWLPSTHTPPLVPLPACPSIPRGPPHLA